MKLKLIYEDRSVEVNPITGKVLKKLSSGAKQSPTHIISALYDSAPTDNLSYIDALRVYLTSMRITNGQPWVIKKQNCECGRLNEFKWDLTAERLNAIEKPAIHCGPVVVGTHTFNPKPVRLSDVGEGSVAELECRVGNIDELLLPEIIELAKIVSVENEIIFKLLAATTKCEKCGKELVKIMDIGSDFLS